ncbi:MAG: hypothetical protein NTW46_03220 [Candidatus Nealsonbacteria bacterium]|nr:hypothetical protein [Candidatus Nealsonbacteria bacterium]
MISNATLDRLALEILRADALELREVPAKVTNEQVESLPLENRPFLYASGNWGPGYVTVKGQVGRQKLIKMLGRYLAFELAEQWPINGIEFVAGNVTGGMVPGWIVSEELSILFGRTIPFVYIRELRKTGGQKELITGIQNNPEISVGANGLDMEELVNFAQTIINGAGVLREAGFDCNKGACILYYDNPVANKDLQAAGISMVYLLTLSRLISVALSEGTHPKPFLMEYERFRKDPLQWQADRGLTRVVKGGTQ